MTESPPAPTTTASPAVSPAPEPQFADFDKAFPDDGLDSPEPAKPASTGGTQSPPSAAGAEKPSKPSTSTGSTDAPSAKTATKDGKDTSDTAPDVEGVEGDEYNPPQVAKPSELRGWALRMGKKAKQANEQLTQLQQRLRVLESQPQKQSESVEALTLELARLKKENDQLSTTVKYKAYEEHPEYEKNYNAPYKKALNDAYEEVADLIVYEPNEEDPDNPKQRTGTRRDFEEILYAEPGAAGILAQKKFGAAYPQVIALRREVIAKAKARYDAIQEYKTKGAQIDTETKAQAAAREAGMLKMFTMATDGHSKRNPEVFLPRDGDNEGNELLEKGKGFASMVFGGNDGLSPQQIAMRDGRAYNWLTAFPRLMRDVKTLRSQIAEANQTIEQLRGSAPGKPKTAAEPAPKTAGSWEEEFDAKVPR